MRGDFVDPIQLQCGSCGQMMSISPEHMGAQVQCPHCQAIVQTPAPAPQMVMAPAPMEMSVPAPLNLGEHESIFAPPQPTDDLFGAAALPQIEMPRMEPAPAPKSPPAQVQAYQHSDPAPAPLMESIGAATADADLQTFTPARRVAQSSMLTPILLIFLVPYAIATTAFIGYLLYTWPRDNPLKNLQDIGPNGKPRLQVKHDYDLDQDMKTVLGRPIRVGDIEVTPLHVKHTADNDLVLVFKAKNVSQNLIFNPIADDYMKFSRKSLTGAKPYTFLERLVTPALPRIYGGNLEWYKGAPGREKSFDGDIGPGEEATIHLISELDYRKREVDNFVKARERLLWRVQVRRGLVRVDGKDISATTVIGVEFTARDIEKEKTAG